MIGTFLLGAAGYPALELLSRGRTHPSMALAGGLSTLLMRRVSRTPISLPAKSLLCGAGVTAIEAAVGLAFNRDHHIWDYRHMPMNWRGQICLPYSFLWCALSSPVLLVMRQLSSKGGTPPPTDAG